MICTKLIHCYCFCMVFCSVLFNPSLCRLYKHPARNICKMADAEKYSIAFVTIGNKEDAAKLSEYV